MTHRLSFAACIAVSFVWPAAALSDEALPTPQYKVPAQQQKKIEPGSDRGVHVDPVILDHPKPEERMKNQDPEFDTKPRPPETLRQ